MNGVQSKCRWKRCLAFVHGCVPPLNTQNRKTKHIISKRWRMPTSPWTFMTGLSWLVGLPTTVAANCCQNVCNCTNNLTCCVVQCVHYVGCVCVCVCVLCLVCMCALCWVCVCVCVLCLVACSLCYECVRLCRLLWAIDGIMHPAQTCFAMPDWGHSLNWCQTWCSDVPEMATCDSESVDWPTPEAKS